jgi:radical SAM-linked protein
MQRIRILFSKGEALQFTGHLDLHKIWERTFRRAHLPLSYSQGFHPQPRIQLACALPLGFTSTAELADVWLDSDLSIDEITRSLTDTAQPGLIIHAIESIPVYQTPLQNRVTSVVYNLRFLDPINLANLEQKIQLLLEKPVLLRERRGKTYDLRPLIENVKIFHEGSHVVIRLQISALPGATGRPEEFLEELNVDPSSVDIQRIEIHLRPLEPGEIRA